MTLLGIDPYGRTTDVANDYEAIKAAMDGAMLDVVGLPDGRHGVFVDDEGMLTGQPLNVPASIMTGMALYGPVVLHGGADDEGETLPPDDELRKAFAALASYWTAVCVDALRKGQSIIPVADPATVPPAQIIPLTDSQFEQYLKGEWPWQPDEPTT